MNPDPFQHDMVLTFFASNQSGKYKLNDLCFDFIDRYKFASKRHKYGDDIFIPVQKDISSVLNTFFTDDKRIAMRNFIREETSDGYIFSYQPKSSCHVLPTQKSFDFEETDDKQIYLEKEIIKTEENKQEDKQEEIISKEISPLMEDIIAADQISAKDPIESFIENLEIMNLHNFEEVNVVRIVKNKRVQMIITNA